MRSLIVDACVRGYTENRQRGGDREMREKEEMTMWETPSGHIRQTGTTGCGLDGEMRRDRAHDNEQDSLA